MDIKCADAYGLLPGHCIQQCHAEQAYTQSKLKGYPTWVRLPKERWPQWWIDAGYVDPVCPLLLALYGHPDSGGYWEKHCEAHLKKVGFAPFTDDSSWRSCFFHPRLQTFLVVYVDDFKMSGPKEKLKEAWSLIKKGLRLDTPVPLGKYLGCHHVYGAAKLVGGKLIPTAEMIGALRIGQSNMICRIF